MSNWVPVLQDDHFGPGSVRFYAHNTAHDWRAIFSLYADHVFVTCDEFGRITRSTDGGRSFVETYQATDDGSVVEIGAGAASGVGFAFVGYAGDGVGGGPGAPVNAVVLYTTDLGATWTRFDFAPGDVPNNSLGDIAWGGGLYMAGSNDASNVGFLATSADGGSWTEVAHPQVEYDPTGHPGVLDEHIGPISWGDAGVWIVGCSNVVWQYFDPGLDLSPVPAGDSIAWSDDDGATWSTVVFEPADDTPDMQHRYWVWSAAAYGAGVYVMTGTEYFESFSTTTGNYQGISRGVLLTSPDGFTWTIGAWGTFGFANPNIGGGSLEDGYTDKVWIPASFSVDFHGPGDVGMELLRWYSDGTEEGVWFVRIAGDLIELADIQTAVLTDTYPSNGADWPYNWVGHETDSWIYPTFLVGVGDVSEVVGGFFNFGFGEAMVVVGGSYFPPGVTGPVSNVPGLGGPLPPPIPGTDGWNVGRVAFG